MHGTNLTDPCLCSKTIRYKLSGGPSEDGGPNGRDGIVLRKEVIQPQVPLRLPCYDFTPVMNHTVVTVPPKVRLATSGATHSHGVTGGVYKARERIHRDILIHDY